jgi:hypothetical protein
MSLINPEQAKHKLKLHSIDIEIHKGIIVFRTSIDYIMITLIEADKLKDFLNKNL